MGAGYTTGMKTAVSLPDRVYQEAEGYAKRTRKSRSQLYAEAWLSTSPDTRRTR